MNYTPIARLPFLIQARRSDRWSGESHLIQEKVLRSLLRRAAGTET